MNQPLISILIASRNEEKVLPACLGSIERLNYPKDKIQLILADDDSSDGTLEILNGFATAKKWVEVLQVGEPQNDEKLKGKTRVLAKMAEVAKGEYWFFTDADIVLPKNWIEGFLTEFEKDKNVGICVGVTGYKPIDFMSKMLALEWYFVLYFCKVLASFNIKSTGLGNNMAITKKAYLAIGGYETIGFSIIEDYLIYQKILEKGFKPAHVYNENILAFTTKPEHYFKQRKRWMTGTLNHSMAYFSIAVLTAFIFPFLIFLAFTNLKTFGILYSILLFTNTFVYFKVKSYLKIEGLLTSVPIYTVFLPASWFLQLVYFIAVKKVDWKDRKY